MFLPNSLKLKNSFAMKTVAAIMTGTTVFSGFSAERFYHHWNAAQIPEESFKPDAIAVLTGGTGRIKAGIEAMDARNRLLVSGAHPNHTDPYQLMDHLEYDLIEKFISANRIDIRSNATNTIGNAMEIDRWLKENPYVKNLLIVTSGYHTPRAHLELMRILPDHLNVRFEKVSNSDVPWELPVKEALKIGCREMSACSYVVDFLSQSPLRKPYSTPNADGQN